MKYSTEEVFERICNDYNSDKGGLLSENENEDDIGFRQASNRIFWQCVAPHTPHPWEGLERINQQVHKMQQKDQMPLTNPC